MSRFRKYINLVRRVAFLFVLSTPAMASTEHMRYFELGTALSIETGWARSFVQNGEPKKFVNIDLWQPYCSVEVKTVASFSGEVVVQPDIYVVERVRRRQPIGGYSIISSLNGDDPGPIDLQLDFELSSKTDKNIVRLRCQRTVDRDFHSQELSVNEVHQALGNLATLK